jgi:RNA polymerase sigma factor (sigma-70 family)
MDSCGDSKEFAALLFQLKNTGTAPVSNFGLQEDMEIAPERPTSRHLFWMSSKLKDKKGRKANPAVIEAAQKVYSNAASYMEQQIGDLSAAHDLMEKAIYLVSDFIRRRGKNAITTSLDGVVMAAFNQLLQAYVRRQNRYVPLDELEKWQEKNIVDSNQELFCLLQMEDLLESVPPEAAVIFKMLYEGYSAEEIGRILELSSGTVRAQVFYWRRKIKGLENLKKSRWKKWRRPGME